MKIRLLKNHTLGKQDEVIDVPVEKANYLVRMKVAKFTNDLIKGYIKIQPEHLISFGEMEIEQLEKEKSELLYEAEKHEFTPQNEKQVHEGLPVTKKRGRPRKVG